MTIEELIEKYKKLLSDVPQKMDEMDAWIATAFVMILEDLKSLQEPIEEREVEKCKPPKFNSFLCQMFWHKSATGGAYDEDVRCDRCWTSIFIDRDWYRSD